LAFQNISLGAGRRGLAGLIGRPGGIRRPAAFFIIICIVAGLLAPAFLKREGVPTRAEKAAVGPALNRRHGRNGAIGLG